MRRSSFRSLFLGLALITPALACSSRAAPPPEGAIATAVPSHAEAQLRRYPGGGWQFVDPMSLRFVVLWVSHVLIRHQHSDNRVTGTLAEWRLADPPQRTREEALALSNDLAGQIAAAPARFEEIARAHSEDTTTAPLGGSLGGVRASDLLFDPQLLDALAVLRPGEISRVIETSHGFHILQRRAPPEPQRVSGLHIVIGHRDAGALAAIGGPAVSRSREEALSIATDLFRQAQGDPRSFSELARAYSDHPDASGGGDLGTWSLREPTPRPRSLEQLQRLAVGELAPPIESPWGYEVLLRTPDPPRQTYAMEVIEVPRGGDDPASVAEDMATAREIAAQVARDPDRFDQFRKQYCCAEPRRWSEGRDDRSLGRAVGALRLAQIASDPVPQYATILIPKRVDPRALPDPPPTTFELPAPTRLSVEQLLTAVSMRRIIEELVAIARDGTRIELNEQQQRLLAELNAELGEGHEAPSKDSFAERVNALLGAGKSNAYRDLLEVRLSRLVLPATSVDIAN